MLRNFANVHCKQIIRLKSTMSGPVEQSIARKLSDHFKPQHLEVLNESRMHNVPPGSETHFKVFVVSSDFTSIGSLINRHRAVNNVLSHELNNGVHALSIIAKTPEEYDKMETKKVEPSPKCRGGFGK